MARAFLFASILGLAACESRTADQTAAERDRVAGVIENGREAIGADTTERAADPNDGADTGSHGAQHPPEQLTAGSPEVAHREVGGAHVDALLSDRTNRDPWAGQPDQRASTGATPDPWTSREGSAQTVAGTSDPWAGQLTPSSSASAARDPWADAGLSADRVPPPVRGWEATPSENAPQARTDTDDARPVEDPGA